jgi:hypothetical protein
MLREAWHEICGGEQPRRQAEAPARCRHRGRARQKGESRAAEGCGAIHAND